MNVLLIGGAGSMIDNLIIKLKKERHRIFLLTGDRFGRLPYQKVFEKYSFSYTDNCLGEIFESVSPELVIYLGAWDTNFGRKDEKKDAVRYSAGLMNILMGFSGVGKGRFLYLSSHEVYSGYHEEDITEDTPVSPVGYRAMALAQAEAMCESYRTSRNLDIVTLRLDHLYGVPDSMRDVRDICTRMCRKALDRQSVTVHDNRVSMLFERDAVEYIYRVGVCVRHRSPLYHISSMDEISESQIAELIQSYRKTPTDIIIDHNASYRIILSNRLYDSEFGCPFFCGLSEVIGKILDRMWKNRDVFLHGEEGKLSFYQRLRKKAGRMIRALIPFAENMVAFIPFFMLNNRAVGSDYFSKLDFYLLYVLLFAIVYGQQQATFSAVLAVAGYCFRQMYDRSGFELMLDVNTYVWIAQLFILGLAVGYMRDNISRLKRESEDEKEFLSGQLSDIHDINSSNVRVKDALEIQVVSQDDSVGKIYSITSELDQYSAEEVLFYAAEVVGRLMKSKDVAIYVVSNESYARLFSATSEKARTLGNSIRYREMEELYEALIARKVYINRSLNEHYPLMASAILDDRDALQMIVMAWNIPWERMTLGQANQLVVVSSLIRNAATRANRYLAALEEKRYREGTHIMETEAFSSLSEAYRKAQTRGLTRCMLLKIQADPAEYGKAGAAILEKLRQTDYIGTLEDGNLYVLLANTEEKSAGFVIRRLEEAGYRCDVAGG